MKKALIFCLVTCCLCALSACSSSSSVSDEASSSAGVPLIPPSPTNASTSVTTTTFPSATATTVPTQPVNNRGQEIAALASSLLGSEFLSGGITPNGFDNSGFVYYCYKQNGITIPRRAADMAKSGTEISADALQAGDIVIFSHEVGGAPSFVGIYIGNGEFVACHNPDTDTVKRNMKTNYYTTHFVTARRYS